MEEKRRATTFRTSKGTVVNVAYPDIYISPAFITSEDVTSETETREALREELDDLNLVEVQFPSVITHPEIRQIFREPKTGVIYVQVRDVDACYVCEMTDAYTVSRIVRQIFSRGQKDAALVLSVFYDWYNDNWLVFTTNMVVSRYGGFYRFSKNWDLIASQDPLLVDGATFEGALNLPLYLGAPTTKGLHVIADAPRALEPPIGDGGGAGVAYTSDFTASIPVWAWKPRCALAEAANYKQYTPGLEYGYGRAFDDYFGAVNLGAEKAFIIGAHLAGGARTPVPAYALYDRNRDVMVCGVSDEPLVNIHMPTLHSYVLGFDLTNLFKKEFLLYQTLEEPKSPAADYWDYPLRTYALRLPRDLLKPENHSVTWHLWLEKSIGINEVSPAIPGYGGSKTVYFFTDTAGTVTLQANPAGRERWWHNVASDAIPAGGSWYYIMTGGALRVRLRFSAAATVWAFIVTEPKR